MYVNCVIECLEECCVICDYVIVGTEILQYFLFLKQINNSPSSQRKFVLVFIGPRALPNQ